MKNKGGGATALVLMAPALLPLHQAARACECRSHVYENTSIFAPHFSFPPEDDQSI